MICINPSKKDNLFTKNTGVRQKRFATEHRLLSHVSTIPIRRCKKEFGFRPKLFPG